MTMGTLTQHIYPETEQMTHAEPTQSLSWRDCEIELAREVQNRTIPHIAPTHCGPGLLQRLAPRARLERRLPRLF